MVIPELDGTTVNGWALTLAVLLEMVKKEPDEQKAISVALLFQEFIDKMAADTREAKGLIEKQRG